MNVTKCQKLIYNKLGKNKSYNDMLNIEHIEDWDGCRGVLGQNNEPHFQITLLPKYHTILDLRLSVNIDFN